jgi:hypothetical protein
MTLQACGQRNPARIAVIGQLAPGHSASEVRGFGIAPAFNGLDPGTVVLYRGSDLPPLEASDLQSEPAIAHAALLTAQTNDLSLRSCNYRLADNPKASAVASRAVAFMVDRGLVSQSQVAAGSTIFLLTDNPLNAAQMYFAVVLASPATATSSASQTLTPIVATIERGSGRVLGAGVANWYAGQ